MQDSIRSGISELHAEGKIAVLTIDNGPKNLLTEPEFIDREELLVWLERNPQAEALVITGAGRHFSHGADVTRFTGGSSAGLSEKLERARELLRTIEELPIVTAAAINGGCFGGGLEIALSCHFRICSPSAFLGLTEIMHGVVPGMGGMERMLRLLGREKALRLILGGEILSAKDAMAAGLVTKISEEKDSLPCAKQYVTELTDGKSRTQINAILETFSRTFKGVKDPSAGMFEKTLSEKNSNE